MKIICILKAFLKIHHNLSRIYSDLSDNIPSFIKAENRYNKDIIIQGLQNEINTSAIHTTFSYI